MSRFKNRRIVFNDKELYEQILEERDVKYIRHYETPSFHYPDYKEVQDMFIDEHVWVKGDRYFKLAHKHYGDSKMWWIIAWYNEKPTEAHLNLGDIVFIPKPLGKALMYMRNR